MTIATGAIDVTMPQLGETVAEGTVTRWLRQVGEQVTEGEPLFEVSTDKVDTEVPAAASGRLSQILVPEDATVPVGARLAVIDAFIDAGDPPPLPTLRGIAAATSAPHRERHNASPRARRLLLEHGLDPAAVRGSRSDGRVSGADVLAAARQHEQPARMALVDVATADVETAARHTGYVAMDVDFQLIDVVRAEVQPAWVQREGFELDYLPFVAHSALDAMRSFPQVNGNAATATRQAVHLGLDCDAVIADAGDLRLAALARAIAQPSSAPSGPAPTMLLRHPGRFGTRLSRGPLPPTGVAVLALDGVRPTPVAVSTLDGYAIAVRPVGTVSLTFDLDRVDEATAARFLRRVTDLLESTAWRDVG